MLARYGFNDIIQYLNDNTLENIYDKQYLKVLSITDVKHTKYNFVFNHDYKITNGIITNYDNIVERFKEKINDWKNMCVDKTSPTIFIHCSIKENLNELHITKMMTALRNQRPEGPNYMFIFTDKDDITVDIENVTIIPITGERICYPWELSGDKRKNAERHVYSKFIDALKMNNIEHKFPLP